MLYRFIATAFLLAGCLSVMPASAQIIAEQDSDTVIPHIAFGGEWITIVTLVNVEAAAIDVTVRFYDGNGTALPVPTDTQGSTAAYPVRIQGNGSHQFTIAGGSTVMQGWADIKFDPNVGAVQASAIFRQIVAGRQDLEALSPSVTRAWQLRVPFDQVGGYQTGLALANPNAEAITINAFVRNQNGEALNSTPVQIQLPARGHTAFILNDNTGLRALVAGRGVLDFVGDSPFAVLGLRFSPSFSFTTILPYEFSY